MEVSIGSAVDKECFENLIVVVALKVDGKKSFVVVGGIELNVENEDVLVADKIAIVVGEDGRLADDSLKVVEG